MEGSKERDILEYQFSCLHQSFPWSFLVKELLPRDKHMRYERCHIAQWNMWLGFFFLILFVRRSKRDPCVKSGLHLEPSATSKRRAVSLSTVLLCPRSSSSRAVAAVLCTLLNGCQTHSRSFCL